MKSVVANRNALILGYSTQLSQNASLAGLNFKSLSSHSRSMLMTSIKALFITSMLSACENQENKKPAPAKPKVVVAAVLQQTIPIIMHFPGTVRGNKKVIIKPQVSGYIEQQLFTDGTEVKSGDPLYQIDPRPFQANLDASYAQLKKDQASLSFWNVEVERYQKLLKKGFVSKERMDSALTREKEFSAAILKDQADIQQSKLDLEYCHITAPFAGWIQETKVYPGAIVSAQQSELTTLTSLNPVYVDFQMSRQEAYRIQELSAKGLGPQKRSDITGTLTLPDNTLYAQQGHIDYSSASFNPNTDTMAVRAIFPNLSMIEKDKNGLGLSLIPGQYIPLNLTVGHHPNALLIPQTALQETQQGSFVYVLDKNDKVAQRLVQRGVAYQQYWVIAKGLQAGERIVVEGLQKIKKPGIVVLPIKADVNKKV